MDTIENMKTFLTTMEHGNFSRAARQLGIAPSAVTKRINLLEWTLRNKLLKRTTRRIELTEAGERYLETIRRIVREFDDVVRGALVSPDQLDGNVRIAAPASLLRISVGAVLSKFQADHPHVTVDAVLIERTVNPTEEGFDVALTVLPASFEGVVEEPLHAFGRVICASADYLARSGVPQTPSDLLAHQCVVYSAVGSTWTIEGPNGLVHVKVRPRITANSGKLVNEIVGAGGGIAVMSRLAAEDGLRAGTLQVVLADHRVPDLWLKALVPASRIHLARVQALLGYFRRECLDISQGLS